MRIFCNTIPIEARAAGASLFVMGAARRRRARAFCFHLRTWRPVSGMSERLHTQIPARSRRNFRILQGACAHVWFRNPCRPSDGWKALLLFAVLQAMRRPLPKKVYKDE